MPAETGSQLESSFSDLKDTFRTKEGEIDFFIEKVRNYEGAKERLLDLEQRLAEMYADYQAAGPEDQAIFNECFERLNELMERVDAAIEEAEAERGQDKDEGEVEKWPPKILKELNEKISDDIVNTVESLLDEARAEDSGERLSQDELVRITKGVEEVVNPSISWLHDNQVLELLAIIEEQGFEGDNLDLSEIARRRLEIRNWIKRIDYFTKIVEDLNNNLWVQEYVFRSDHFDFSNTDSYVSIVQRLKALNINELDEADLIRFKEMLQNKSLQIEKEVGKDNFVRWELFSKTFLSEGNRLIAELIAVEEEQKERKSLPEEIEKKYQELLEAADSPYGDYTQPIRAEILRMAEKLGGEAKTRWIRAMDLKDGFVAARTKSKDWELELALSGSTESWELVKGGIQLDEIAELIDSDKEIEHALNVLKIIFSEMSDYSDSILKYLEDNKLALPENEKDKEEFVKKLKEMCKHNYCLRGNPERNLIDLLELVFPEFKSSSLSIAQEIVVCTGLRDKYAQKWLFAYSTSPRGSFEGAKTTAKLTAPLAYICYYVRGRGWLPAPERDMAYYYGANFTRSEGDYDEGGVEYRQNKNVKALSDLWKGWFEKLFTDADFSQYQANAGQTNLGEWSEEFQILPTPWDLIELIRKQKKSGRSNDDGNVLELSFGNYIEGMGNWEKYINAVKNLHNLKIERGKGDQVINSKLTDFRSMISALKGVSEPLKGTEYYDRFLKMINFLFLVALKRMFRSYFSAARIQDVKTVRNRFFNIVEGNILSANLHKKFQEEVEEIIEKSRYDQETKRMFSPRRKVGRTIRELKLSLDKPLRLEFEKFISSEIPEEAKDD
jgi:hypothetical protein